MKAFQLLEECLLDFIVGPLMGGQSIHKTSISSFNALKCRRSAARRFMARPLRRRVCALICRCYREEVIAAFLSSYSRLSISPLT